MQNILISGGAGFIGSNFIHHLLKSVANIKVVNLDALTYAGRLENLEDLPHNNEIFFVKGDICDSKLASNLLSSHKIDTIVHFAAESHVDRSIIGPAKFIQTNIVGTFTLLEAARKYWLEEKQIPVEQIRFHHISTDEVFGSLEPDDPAFTESTPYSPRSPYSASKAASDHLVRSYFHTYGLPITITNCSNNYGPRQFPEKLIPLVILNALSGKDIPVYGDGGQIRDWLYVEDHCVAIIRVIKNGKPGQTYNIGGNNQFTNLQVIHKICEILDRRFPQPDHKPHSKLIRFVADRPGHDRRYAMDIGKIQSELGWKPMESLESGLVKTIDWYLEHPDWINSIQQRQDYQGWLDQNYRDRGGI
jgi:dTDP-glucose 4,6-dehydratase